MGAVSRAGVQASIERALEESGISQSEIVRTVSTGYGRRLVAIADQSFTEITCHARGAATWPGVRLVIDIGGQDRKVIAVDENGLVDRFAMNDRCASGTGTLLRGARPRAGDRDRRHGRGRPAGLRRSRGQQHVRDLRRDRGHLPARPGAEKADVAASVHRAVAARTLGLVARVGKRTPVVMTGGVAKNPAAVHYLPQALSLDVHVPTTRRSPARSVPRCSRSTRTRASGPPPRPAAVTRPSMRPARRRSAIATRASRRRFQLTSLIGS